MVKSDQYLTNSLYGKGGNNADGAKADVIGRLDLNDRIKILGVASSEIHIAAVTKTLGDSSYSGLGITAGGALEAIYTGGNLTIAQLAGIVSGDDSAAVLKTPRGSTGAWADFALHDPDRLGHQAPTRLRPEGPQRLPLKRPPAELPCCGSIPRVPLGRRHRVARSSFPAAPEPYVPAGPDARPGQ